jgi:hypothetical protein
MPHGSDAHYLHIRVGLTKVVQPRVREVSAMAWTTGQRLVVVTRRGEGFVVHPVHGTTPLWTGRAPAIGLCARGEELVVVEADGVWRQLTLAGEERLSAAHPFTADVEVQFDDHAVLMCGPTATDRRLKFFVDGRKALRVILPPRATARMNGAVELVRATADGLELLPLEAGRRFSRAPTAADVLHIEGDHVLGVSADEVRVWRGDGVCRARIRLPGPTVATVHAAEQLVAVGTEDGGVALVDLTQGATDVAPNTVHLSRDRIADLAFSHTGRWLASGSGGLTIWAWDVAR